MTETITFRIATADDLDDIVKMLADDVLGNKRERYETPLPDSYIRAFHAIDCDPNNELIVACDGTEIVGLQQITFTPYIARQGVGELLLRVRTVSSKRGKGIGTKLIKWAIQRATLRGCHLVQLTTDKERQEALQFYKKLGFKDSHEGLKLFL